MSEMNSGNLPVVRSAEDAAASKRRREEAAQRAERATLTKDGGLQSKRLNEILKALPSDEQSTDYPAPAHRDLIAFLNGIGPQDELELMMLGQMYAAHRYAMQAFQRSSSIRLPRPQQAEYLKSAEKLMGAFAKHMAALDKHRGKGQQKVTVKHVHVQEGGHAIVGNVETGPRAPGESAFKAIDNAKKDQGA